MTSKPLRTGLVAAALTATALTGCSSNADGTASLAAGPRASGTATSGGAASSSYGTGGSRLDTVKQSKVLRVCTTGDYRPFTYLDPKTKQYQGIDVDMAKSLAASLGARIQWVPTTWKTLMPDYLATCDIGMGGISISTERAQQAFFSEPVLTEGKTPITLCKNVSRYDTVAEINQPGVRSITPEGGTNEKFARARYPRGTVTTWKDNNTIFDQIIAGKADVMTTDASETVWVAHTHPQLCAVHPEKPFNFSQKAYLLPRGDTVFQQNVDQWLVGARHDGTWSKATRPWFGATQLS